MKEARSIYWLKNNHRPLGELLDEGFLNESRLSWAAEKAYNPQLKEAAGVILRHLRRSKTKSPTKRGRTSEHDEDKKATIQTNITVKEARSTLWPFRGYRNQPMGKLSDTRKLSLKDLAYAVENAWDRRVRQAAIVLLAQRLQQAVEEPDATEGSPKIVAPGRTFSQRRQMAWVGIQMLGIGVSSVLLLEAMVWSIIRFIKSPPRFQTIIQSPTLIIFSVVGLGLSVAVGLGISKLIEHFIDKTEQEIENNYLGQKGEDRVIEEMQQNLNGAWTIFRNVTLPGRDKTDIDAVLVGPAGEWALEIKNYQGEYRTRGETWEFRSGKDWKVVKKSPSAQAARGAVRLHDFLRVQGVSQWVDKAVIWANPENPPIVKDPAVAVWPFDRLADELGNLQQRQTLDTGTRATLVKTLKGLCKRNADEDPWL
jgi:hypothetical protein